ncbi:hypothetical protein DY000_02016105 [Brassica cretica]|uniref:Uncharacterized protein n=1 Tax=Brassica cretica TaxID=69181 RepID=A0ABQ7CR40_BRACR|nr:hypothetical protein DY000_02016105 [Brassica cretica]
MLRLNLTRERSQLGRADGPGPGQWQAVRSGHEAMGYWVFGQSRGLSPEGLVNGLGFCPTQTQSE